ncbi:hypothetical protein HDU86_007771 [Geranomyces michiganensis]|nr:hypothetical protein HDU86_007771 [Geranomyces michiganensis]
MSFIGIDLDREPPQQGRKVLKSLEQVDEAELDATINLPVDASTISKQTAFIYVGIVLSSVTLVTSVQFVVTRIPLPVMLAAFHEICAFISLSLWTKTLTAVPSKAAEPNSSALQYQWLDAFGRATAVGFFYKSISLTSASSAQYLKLLAVPLDSCIASFSAGRLEMLPFVGSLLIIVAGVAQWQANVASAGGSTSIRHLVLRKPLGLIAAIVGLLITATVFGLHQQSISHYTAAVTNAATAACAQVVKHIKHKDPLEFAHKHIEYGGPNPAFYGGPAIPAEWEWTNARDPAPNCPDYDLQHLSAEDYVPRIFDFFPFATDHEMLEVRLNELDPVVDKFVLCESRKTFQNGPKEVLFEKIKDDPRFAPFKDKIIHIILDELEGDDAWAREKFTRREMMRQGYEQTGIQDGDIVLMGDVDEIPRGSLLRRYKACKGWAMPMCLQVPFSYYSFEYRHRPNDWKHPDLYRYPDVPDPNEPRNKDMPVKCQLAAGWHCSYCFTNITSFRVKLESFSHTEYNREEFKSDEYIFERVSVGLDFFNRGSDSFQLNFAWEVDGPSWLMLTRPKHLRPLWDRVFWVNELGGDGVGLRNRGHPTRISENEEGSAIH